MVIEIDPVAYLFWWQHARVFRQERRHFRNHVIANAEKKTKKQENVGKERIDNKTKAKFAVCCCREWK